jgi:hypothetical protein
VSTQQQAQLQAAATSVAQQNDLCGVCVCWAAAVDAFSKQGVHGLPEGMLLDPWNEEAVLQAQQASAMKQLLRKLNDPA